MVLNFIQDALRNARIEFYSQSRCYRATVPGVPEVEAEATSYEECREALAHALEAWLLQRAEEHNRVPQAV